MVMVVANGLHTEATAKKMKVDDLRALLLPNKPVPPVRASAAGCRSDSSARKMGAPTDAQLAAEARRLSGGANERFEKKLQELDVLRTFSVTYDIARLGGIRAQCSSLTGSNVNAFFSINKSSGKKKWWEALDSAFDGLAFNCTAQTLCRKTTCAVCDVYHVFDEFGSWLLPSVRAMTWKQFMEFNPSMEDGRFSRATWDHRIREWGELFKRTLNHKGRRTVVTNYVHYYVAHSGEQMELHDRPLGYDSQQGVEAAHKDIKTCFFSATSHNGGAGSSSAALQIMHRSYRMLLYLVRNGLSRVEAGSEHKAYAEYLLTCIGYGGEMLELIASSNRDLNHRLSVHLGTLTSIKAAETDETFNLSGWNATEEASDPDVVRHRLDSVEIS